MSAQHEADIALAMLLFAQHSQLLLKVMPATPNDFGKLQKNFVLSFQRFNILVS